MLKNPQLSLYLYTLPTSGNPIINEYSRYAENLTFTTVAPGGFGTLSVDLRLPDLQVPRAEFALFSRVALIYKRTFPVFLGEVVTPSYEADIDSGEVLHLGALGLGNCLRDDPRHTGYLAKTVAQILTNEYSLRSAWMGTLIISDLTKVVPQNPSNTYSPIYDGRYMEEVIADVALLDGDNHWGVWDAPALDDRGTNRDAAGFPLGQIQLHARDLSTTHYLASVARGEVTKQVLTPSADRAYNVTEISYWDGTASPPVGQVTYTDSRLGGGGAQGTAPFRYRKYTRDLSGFTTVSKTQAQAIANAQGALFQNVTNSNVFTVQSIRGAAGADMELFEVRADHNINIPDVIFRGNLNQGGTLATGPVAGLNQFYITQTKYSEDQEGVATLELTTDNFRETYDTRIARLQLKADVQSRSSKFAGVTIAATGAPMRGHCGTTSHAATASLTMLHWVSFPLAANNVPTSVTLSNITYTNGSAATATNITIYGFTLQWTATAIGTTACFADYVTVGN